MRLGTCCAIASLILIASPTMANPAWETQIQEDRMSGTSTTVYLTESVESSSCGRALLYTFCSREGPQIRFKTERCVLSSNDEIIRYRIDDEQATYSSAKLNRNFDGGILVPLTRGRDPSPANSDLLNDLLEAETILLELEPVAKPTQVLEFDVQGLSEIVGQDMNPCLASSSGKSDPAAFSAPLAVQINRTLECRTSPDPTAILLDMRDNGLIDLDQNLGSEGTMCFRIRGGITVRGMNFQTICAYDEDSPTKAANPDLWYRGPGTSPGHFIELGNDKSEGELLSWYASNIRPDMGDKAVTKWHSLFENGGFVDSNAVTCSRWNVRP